MKTISFILVLSTLFSLSTFAQSDSDMLEYALTGVITVSVEDVEATNLLLGYRGNVDVAYEKSPDMSNSLSSGSGFVIVKNGKKYVITNAHVVEMASDKTGTIFVYSIDRTKYSMKLVGGDSFYDLAVLEFVSPPGPEIGTMAFATSEPRIGARVYAIGNPLAEFPYSVSDGIISAKNRVRGGLTGKFGFLQTTATIIYGNSGGPLIDTKGKVVGINSQIAFSESTAEPMWQPQINFALEGTLSNRLVDDILRNNGRVERCYAGLVAGQNYEYFSTYYSEEWLLMDSIPLILGVVPGSPAYSALSNKIGYQIVKAGNEQIRTVEELLGFFEETKPGASITLEITNGYSTEKVTIKTGTLTPITSADIAKYFIDQTDGLSMIEDERALILTIEGPGGSQESLTEKEMYQQQYQQKQDDYTLKSSSRYIVSAAGIYNEYNASMWRITDLADLGYALRLASLSGIIDLYLLQSGYEEGNIQTITLSGDDYVSTMMLWY